MAVTGNAGPASVCGNGNASPFKFPLSPPLHFINRSALILSITITPQSEVVGLLDLLFTPSTPMDSKAQLAREICSVSTIFLSCPHRTGTVPPCNVFVDWYLVLKVEEDALSDVIRRRYRQLALQLHPDKNKSPKAEAAFKLVSEAYSCLSDKSKRRAFNTERCDRFCIKCVKKNQSRPVGSGHLTGASEKKCNESRARPRVIRNLQALREAKRILEEEARVIEKCLRRHGAATSEYPLFDPAEYLLFQDYPHCRRVQLQRDLWRLNSCRGGRRESAVFEMRSDCHKSTTDSDHN